jgi:hypothetical protein
LHSRNTSKHCTTPKRPGGSTALMCCTTDCQS